MSTPLPSFATALAYPFTAGRRKNLVWIPGLLALGLGAALMIVMIILMLPLILVSMASGADARNIKDVVEIILNMASGLGQGLIVAYPAGYLWSWVAHWQNPGQHPAPSWFENKKRYFIDGLKLWLYQIVWSLMVTAVVVVPVVLLILLLVFAVPALNTTSLSQTSPVIFIGLVLMFMALVAVASIAVTPFYFAPIIQSAQTRTLGDLFNFQKGWGKAKRHYKRCLQAMVLIFGISLLYVVAACVLLLTLVGWLWLLFPAYVSTLYLLNAALSDDPPNGSQTPTLIQ